jgi:hypothetical protein
MGVLGIGSKSLSEKPSLNGVKHLNDEILRYAQNDKGFSDRL